MTTIDTSKIDRMDVRREVIALDEKRKKLEAAAKAESKAEDAACDEEIAREEATWNRERDELWRAHKARCDAIRIARGVPIRSAEDALAEHDSAVAYRDVYDFDNDDQAVRCVLTGLPILDGDETIEDSEGRKALARAIVGWPLFESQETDDDAEEDEA
ncbi:MAG TPA: hypothetical protein PKD49_07650 [Hyphomicrobium sp.]|nr:hypothetical protein [Hyphomicrobium sp.]